ncbi:hypothetical protein I4U23_024619 [Adineta vaga]|nr:hypothetical protein I4U23_024619 [Adineta vaga]
MTDNNDFAHIQRLNSTIMAKCEWTSSLMGMRQTGEEVHHRRTKTHRKANAFLQELLDQRSDGNTVDDDGVTDRYHRFLRTKSNLNDDSHVLDEFDRRLRALNNNRLLKDSKSIDTGLNSIRSQIKPNMKDRYWTSSKSTLDSNLLSSIPSQGSQTNIRSNAIDHQSSSSSSEDSTTISQKPSTRRVDNLEETEIISVPSMYRDITQPHVQRDTDRMEESAIPSVHYPSTKTLQKSNVLRMDSSEDAEELSTSLLNRFIAQSHIQQDLDQTRKSSISSSSSSATTNIYGSKVQQTNEDDVTEESIKPSLLRSVTNSQVQYTNDDSGNYRKETSIPSSYHTTTTKIKQKSNVQHADSNEETETSFVSTSKQSTIKNSPKQLVQHTDDSEYIEENSISSVISSATKPLHELQVQQLDSNKSIAQSSTSAVQRSIRKPSNTGKTIDTKHVDEFSKKRLPKSQIEHTDPTRENSETLSSSIQVPSKTLYRPVARRADGSEIISTVTAENPIRNTSTTNSLFNQRFFPRSLLSHESISLNSTKKNLSSSSPPPMKQYDNTQLFYLLDCIENECTPNDFTQILDQLNLSFGQVSKIDDDTAVHNDDNDDDMTRENMTIIPNLFDESYSSQDYYTTFIVNIDDPRKLSLYTMTISTVQLSPFRIIPYSILIGHRPFLQHSKDTNFKRFRSQQYNYTYQVIAVESFTNMERIQMNDIILKINDQSVWNLTIDVVRKILRESNQQSNKCSLKLARLCQPFI